MPAQDHEFDALNRWAHLSDAELEKIISDDAISILQRVVLLLGDEDQQNKLVVNRSNFGSIVHEMRSLYVIGSRHLGEAILEASDWLNKKHPVKAKEVYERFLSICPSKFYGDIARHQIAKLS